MHANADLEGAPSAECQAGGEGLDAATPCMVTSPFRYNVDTWSSQLSSRVASCRAILGDEVDGKPQPLRRGVSSAGVSSEQVLSRACKRIEEDVRRAATRHSEGE